MAPTRQIEVASLTPRLAYKAIVGTTVPRPIAWITTISPSGVVNLAPFSFFTPMAYRPMLFGVAISDLDGGAEKDTLRNLRTTGELVINIASASDAEYVHLTGSRVPAGVSEADEFGIGLLPSATVRPPRVANAVASFECAVTDIVPFAGTSHWVVSRCETLHVRADLVDEELNVDFVALKPLGRLIGDAYQLPGEVARFSAR